MGTGSLRNSSRLPQSVSIATTPSLFWREEKSALVGGNIVEVFYRCNMSCQLLAA